MGVVIHPGEGGEQPDRGPIDRYVCALRGQDGGKQKLVRLLPLKFTVGIGMGFGQRVINSASPSPGRGSGCGQHKWKIGTSFGHPEPDILEAMDQVFSPSFVIEESAVGGALSRFGEVAQAGFRSLAMDATVAGRRPRELDVGARSDLRRKVLQHGLQVAGVTFRIPPEHFVREDTADRACAGAVQAIGFAESMHAHWVVLPAVDGEAGVLIQKEAERRGRQVLTTGGTDHSALVEVVGSDAPEMATAFRLVADSPSALQLPFAVFAGLRMEQGFPIFVSGEVGLLEAVRLARDFAALLPECVG